MRDNARSERHQHRAQGNTGRKGTFSHVQKKLQAESAKAARSAQGEETAVKTRSVPAEMTASDVAILVKNASHQFGEPGAPHHVRALRSAN
jgi:hypothetical protein